MNRFNKRTVDQLKAETERATHEAEVVISWGEDLLDRAHEVGHEIEEHVHRLLSTTRDNPANSSSSRRPPPGIKPGKGW